MLKFFYNIYYYYYVNLSIFWMLLLSVGFFPLLLIYEYRISELQGLRKSTLDIEEVYFIQHLYYKWSNRLLMYILLMFLTFIVMCKDNISVYRGF